MSKLITLSPEGQRWYSEQPPVVSFFPLRRDKVIFTEPVCVCGQCGNRMHHSMVRGIVYPDEADFVMRAIGKCLYCDSVNQFCMTMFVDKGVPSAEVQPHTKMPWETMSYANVTKDKILEQLLL